MSNIPNHSFIPIKHFQYKSFKLVKNEQETLRQMYEMEEELEGTDLRNLRAFNKTYLIITKNVLNKLDTGYFKKDVAMRSVDTAFGNYYFRALHGYISEGKCPPAWKLFFDACHENSHHQFVYMGLGVNAHVNNDLPQTLFDVLKGDLFKQDYNKINEVIAQSLKDVILNLNEKSATLNTAQNYLLSIYKLTLASLIRNWRNKAWENYLMLNKDEISISSIEDEASVIAKKLLAIKHVHDLPKIFSTLYF